MLGLLFLRPRLGRRVGAGVSEQGKMDFHKQTAFRPIEGRDAAAMKAYRSFRNGQTKANSAGLSSSIIIQTIEWLKQFFQRIRGNAGSTIGDAHHGFAAGGVRNFLEVN